MQVSDCPESATKWSPQYKKCPNSALIVKILGYL